MAEEMKNIFRDDDDRPATTPSKQGGAKLILALVVTLWNAARKYDTGTTPKKSRKSRRRIQRSKLRRRWFFVIGF